ncbi:response regulator transcription factor [Butyricimonas paravirosa]
MKILIIEDEKDLREVMTRSLEKERFVVETAADYSTALQKINDYDYDCILLDIMLPGGSGLSILEELKKLKKRESVIIVSAKDSIEDKVTGLDLGADDYLAKPFHLAELHARVKSVIRRHQTDGNTEIEIENLTVCPDDHTVFINGEELKLNRKEFDLLYYFVTNPNRLINKTTLAESVWGDNIDQADSLDFIYSQVKNLRKKMKNADAIPEIKAVYGFGYKLITTPEA